MTPLHLKILLQCYSVCEAFPIDNETVRSFHKDLENMGLIQPRTGTDYFETTEKGAAHVLQLLQLPLPVQQWVTVDGKAIRQK